MTVDPARGAPAEDAPGTEPRRDSPSVRPESPALRPEDRRAAPRFAPEPFVPVLFAHPDAETPTAGLLADVSDGGVRIVAPPTARPHLHWGDPLTILVSYSDAARESGIEGLTLGASVVRITVDASGYTLAARFDRANGDWSSLTAWIHQLARRGPV